MPNLRQLEYLVALADTRHFRRAAERCATTQPTLSEQLKALERRLGATLIERTRARVMPTPLGAQVIEIARRMLADAREIEMLAASGGSELSGVVRLGLPPTIGPYLLPAVIPEMHRAFPALKFYVREELPSALPAALAEGRHDLVLTLLPVTEGQLVTVPLFREPLFLAVARAHPLARLKTARRADLAGQDVLTLGKGHQLHEAVNALCEGLGARLRLDYEGTSLDTLREMVAMGLGVTFLPGLYVRAIAERDTSLRILPLADRSLYRRVGLVWRRTSPWQDRYRELADLLRAQVRLHFPDL
ncbi:MAG: LysR substrate-binding domain-containing protein [Hyphomicrobiaceae bacterium]